MNKTQPMSQGTHVLLYNNVTILSMLWLSYLLGHENIKEGTAIKTVVIITFLSKWCAYKQTLLKKKKEKLKAVPNKESSR